MEGLEVFTMSVKMRKKGGKSAGKEEPEITPVKIMPPIPEGYMLFRGALLLKPEISTEDKPRSNGSPYPRKVIDPMMVEMMACLMCTMTEIAEWYGMSKQSLYYRMTSDPPLRKAFRRGRVNAMQQIRAKQMEVATTHGDVRMLIHLGKQYLGQADKIVLDQGNMFSLEETEFAEVAEDEFDAEISGIIAEVKKQDTAKKARGQRST